MFLPSFHLIPSSPPSSSFSLSRPPPPRPLLAAQSEPAPRAHPRHTGVLWGRARSPQQCRLQFRGARTPVKQVTEDPGAPTAPLTVCSRRVVPAATPAVCLTLGACRNAVACAIALRVTPLHGQGGFGTEKCPAEVPARDRAGIGGWEGRPPADQTQEGGKERRPRETFSWTLTLASPG